MLLQRAKIAAASGCMAAMMLKVSFSVARSHSPRGDGCRGKRVVRKLQYGSVEHVVDPIDLARCGPLAGKGLE